jgi:excisionase family DNA binding protein
MEEEYVTIIEAARRIGMSDKTVRRAIHDGKLEARYPQLNRAEVSVKDLEAWHAILHVEAVSHHAGSPFWLEQCFRTKHNN